MLHKKNRLNRSRSIKYILRNGSRIKTQHMDINWVKIRDDEFRCAFIASKKVGNSVYRNRATRLMREAVRLLLKKEILPTGIHVVIVAKPSILRCKSQAVYSELERQFKTIQSQLEVQV